VYCCCCFLVFQRLVSVVADGIYIHSLCDMKLLHVIPNSLHDVPSVCILSRGMPLLGQVTPSYFAYSDSGNMKIFDTADLVSMQSYILGVLSECISHCIVPVSCLSIVISSSL